MIKLVIDGKTCQAEQGSMIIEAADDANITIPRFCYHKKLSVAANCRMCLVEVERSGKPLPACATPVTDGMVVHTKSPKALAAQRSVMEFLLINHPLDCPVCDQAGECELQDVSMGFGKDVSRYTMGKRSVADKDIGPLIATDMTRCIHCTRCVRFGQEIAHLPELGLTGRGEHAQIGTFVDKIVQSEVSGNSIDVCPVGALTNKVFRFTSRTWELEQTPVISPHDCVGTNLLYQARAGSVARVVPDENESVNEIWCSDRDRYSFKGFENDRISTPMVKENGAWREVDWEVALEFAAAKLAGKSDLATLLSPTTTVEEGFLAQKITRALGSNNIDHRLQMIDTRDDQKNLNSEKPDLHKLESMQSFLIIGSNTRQEQPILALRLRKAASMGASVAVMNFEKYDFLLEPEYQWIVPAGSMVQELASIAKAVSQLTKYDSALIELLADVQVNDEHTEFAKKLVEGQGAVIVGTQAQHHPFAAELRALSNYISDATKAAYYDLTQGPNSLGLSLAGAVPFASEQVGESALQICKNEHSAYLLFNIEPIDLFDTPNLIYNLDKTDCVVSLSSYDSELLRRYADVILPVSLPAESSGTYVNMFGLWQSFQGSAKSVGQARPGWKVLRVLGNFLHIDDFEYDLSEQIAKEVQLINSQQLVGKYSWQPEKLSVAQLMRVAPIGLYQSDAIVRRSEPLQELCANTAVLRCNPETARSLGFGSTAKLKDAAGDVASIEVQSSENIAVDTIILAQADIRTARFGGLNQLVTK